MKYSPYVHNKLSDLRPLCYTENVRRGFPCINNHVILHLHTYIQGLHASGQYKPEMLPCLTLTGANEFMFNSSSHFLIFQEGGPGSLPDSSVKGERTQCPLCCRGEYSHHASMLSDRACWHERDHHEGKNTCSCFILTPSRTKTHPGLELD